MKKQVERILDKSLAVLGYAAPIGLGVWGVLRSKGIAPRLMAPGLKKKLDAIAKPEPEAQREKPAEPKAQPNLESLSLSTPGDAPLDQVARRAAWEEGAEEQPGHGRLKDPVPPESEHPQVADPESVAGLLNYQSLASYRLEGWSVPEPKRLPIPTYAPAVMALGIVIFAMGLATVWYVCVVGSLVFAVAAWRWVGELQGE